MSAKATFQPGPKFLAMIDQGQWVTIYNFTDFAQTVAGSAATSRSIRRGRVTTGTTASSTGLLRGGTGQLGWSKGSAKDIINWSKKIAIALVISQSDATTNGVSRFKFGADSGTAVQALANKGIGISIEDNALKGIVHDGSSGATIDLSTTLTDEQVYLMQIVSDGAGNVEWFVDDLSKGTSAAGPTGDGLANDTIIKIECENNADTADQDFTVHDLKIYVEQ